MNVNIVALEAAYDSNVFAAKCNAKDTGQSCPVKFFKCPFDEKCCEEIEASDWEEIFKKEEVPFRKGELVAVKDKDFDTWIIKVFNSYNIHNDDYKYRVYNNIDNLDDAKCTNFQQCEKLSVFSKKFFFE